MNIVYVPMSLIIFKRRLKILIEVIYFKNQNIYKMLTLRALRFTNYQLFRNFCMC